uniref:Uncharacterized protein n=1 Tax=Anguilla anguilla TaxID=7936 RepID=A0A0E9PAU0_ANGAN
MLTKSNMKWVLILVLMLGLLRHYILKNALNKRR